MVIIKAENYDEIVALIKVNVDAHVDHLMKHAQLVTSLDNYREFIAS